MSHKPTPLPSESARRLIGNARIFRGLSEPRRAELAARAHIRSFAAGETIFGMGGRGDCLMAVLSGRVRVSVTSQGGDEMMLALLGPGDILGEIAVLDGGERTADATAQSACTMAVVDRRDILSLLEREPTAWLAIVELLCARLRSTDRHIAEIALLDLPARLASALLRMSDEGKSADVRLSQRELGRMVGASRESVNKCIGQWQRSGVVQVDGATIRIVKKSALQRIAEAD